MTSFDAALSELHRRVLNLRNLEHFVSTEQFKEMFDGSPDKIDICQYIKDGNFARIKQWFFRSRKELLPVDEWPLSMLREFAKGRIPMYGIMSKAVLIGMIIKFKENHKD
jgi:hypothetical protein